MVQLLRETCALLPTIIATLQTLAGAFWDQFKTSTRSRQDYIPQILQIVKEQL